MRNPVAVLPLIAAAIVALPRPAAATVSADYSRTPVVMVHGWFFITDAGDGTWTSFKNRLIDDGWPAEYIKAESFANVTGCDPEHAGEIAAWVDELRAHNKVDQVDIVCHSEGCLNTLWYLRAPEYCGVGKVRRFVGLAGAVHGTSIACVDPTGSCGAAEMCTAKPGDITATPDWHYNPALVHVNEGDETPGDILYTSVWAPHDEIINPPDGSIMAGANNLEVQTPGVEHGAIFLVDETYGYVKDALLNGTGTNTDGPGWQYLPAQCRPEPSPEDGDAAEAGDLLPDAADTMTDAPPEATPADVAEEAAGADPAVADLAPDVPPDAASPDPGARDARVADGDDTAAGAEDDADAAGPADAAPTGARSGGCGTGTGVGAGAAAVLIAAMLAAVRRSGRRA